MKEYKKLTEAEFNEKLKKYDEIKAKIRKAKNKENFVLIIFLTLWLLSVIFLYIFPEYQSQKVTTFPMFLFVLVVVGLIILAISSRFKVIDLEKQKEYFDDFFREEKATFEGVITLTNGQEVPGIFIQKGDGFFERKTETLYYKDKVLAVKKI